MDFPRVHTVINYDLPAHIRTYVHRAGRTARAGTSGSVYTILRSEHLSAFGAMMRRGGRKGIRAHRISEEAWQGVKDAVHAALEYVQLQENV
jgi:ATP-dependent RNA helicase DDX51/DBP6